MLHTDKIDDCVFPSLARIGSACRGALAEALLAGSADSVVQALRQDSS